MQGWIPDLRFASPGMTGGVGFLSVLINLSGEKHRLYRNRDCFDSFIGLAMTGKAGFRVLVSLGPE